MKKHKVLALLLCLLPTPALAKVTVIHAGRLIDGVGRAVQPRMTIVVKDNRISEIRPGFIDLPDAEVIDLSTMTVMPGLIDVHVHLALEYYRTPLIKSQTTQTSFDDVLIAARNARTTLMAGFTSVRDVGTYTPVIVALKKAQQSGTVVGPRMWVSGGLLGPTGGHSDFSVGFDPALSRPEWNEAIGDGPEDVIKRVRSRHKMGADLIKIVPSGGLATVGDDPEAQLMTDAEIKAAVDTAHTLGMKVAAHAHGSQAIAHAVALDVDSIEHGTFATETDYKAMKAHGTYMVPTVIAGKTVVDIVKQHPGMMDPSSEAKALAVGPLLSRNAFAAWKAGVKIAFGTDAGIYPHGQNAKEAELLVEAGIPAVDVVLAATSGAAALMGKESEIGALLPNHFADVVATAGNPLDDITELQHIRFVMQGGIVVKRD